MVADEVLDPVTERLIRAWHDAEAIRDMPELFTEEKLAQIAGGAMAAIEEAWQALGQQMYIITARRITSRGHGDH